MKRISASLTLRIFLMTSVLLVVACAITYGTIAYLTPISYTAILEDELSRRSDEVVAALEAVTPEGAGELLDDFVRQTQAEVRLTSADGIILYDTAPQSIGPSEVVEETVVQDAIIGYASESDDTLLQAPSTEAVAVEAYPIAYESENNVDVVQETAVEAEASSVSGNMHSFSFTDGSQAWILIQGGMRAVNQAAEALGQLLPFLVGVVALISLVGSFAYARFITRPIVSIQKIARRMAALDFDARWDKSRKDEIGELGSSLNLLSDNLSGALRELESANAKLQNDIDREREIERQRMAFFSAASHELKTPITILKGQLSGMLARVGIYQDREKYLARALAVTGRMENLVKEILTINRIETSGFSLKMEAVDVSELMQSQLELDQELMEQRGLSLDVRIAPGIVVQGDAALLAKALDNVLMNAILYSPTGAKVIASVKADGFDVENTGVWIPAELLAELFVPFYRVEQSRNRKSGGSGLGLYLVKSILDLHGMACRVENTERGVRFSASFNV